jgi:hypothetical protein
MLLRGLHRRVVQAAIFSSDTVQVCSGISTFWSSMLPQFSGLKDNVHNQEVIVVGVQAAV